jgi:hypothetical protein
MAKKPTSAVKIELRNKIAEYFKRDAEERFKNVDTALIEEYADEAIEEVEIKKDELMNQLETKKDDLGIEFLI